MELTNEELGLIKEYASFLMRIDDIGILLHKDADLFRREVKKRGTAAYLAYESGKLLTRVELQKSVVKMAKLGSPQAQKDIFALFEYQNRNE